MSINPELAGRSYPAGESYQVGREKIREFARAVKATSPAHFEIAAAQKLGYADLVAPPTFAIIVAQQADAQLIRDPAPASTSPGWSTRTSASPTTVPSWRGMNCWLNCTWTTCGPWATVP